jgi:non-specific protein-tyrosine kinase
MIDKIKQTAGLWNRKMKTVKRASPDISEQDNIKENKADGKNRESSGTDKIEKAITFFKQRKRNGGKPASESLEQNAQDEMPHSVQDIPEVHPVSYLQDIPERLAERPVQDMPAEKERPKAGWVSPKYSQSNNIQLNPKLVAENRCLAYLDNVPAAEAYRVLRTQVLQRTRTAGNNTIMVTSALPGEGKTLVSINLAMTFAREFQHTVLLVDGDLRKQSVHKYLGFEGEKGLINYLADDSPLSELIKWPGIEKLTLISGGRSFQESAEILGSPRMKELIADLKGRYPERYIIFDIPPVLTGADALTFAPLVDHVIFVVQAGKTSMDDVNKALQFLPKDKILGFVMNRLP